jgi:hypothetical protein
MSNFQHSTYVDSYEMGHAIVTNSEAFTYVKSSEEKKLRPWVCKITGIDPEFGFKRKFVESKLFTLKKPFEEYLKIVFALEHGYVYEFRNFSVNFDDEPYFRASGYFGVNENGIATLEKTDVRKLLGMKVKEKVAVDAEAWKERPKKKKQSEPEQLGFHMDDSDCKFDKF